MEIYIVQQITEAEYGCEETERKEPAALLKLVSDNEEKYVEVPESLLEKQRIREGKRVIITQEGKVVSYQ